MLEARLRVSRRAVSLVAMLRWTSWSRIYVVKALKKIQIVLQMVLIVLPGGSSNCYGLNFNILKQNHSEQKKVSIDLKRKQQHVIRYTTGYSSGSWKSSLGDFKKERVQNKWCHLADVIIVKNFNFYISSLFL